MNTEWSTTAQSLYHVKEQLKALRAQEVQISVRLRELSDNRTAHDDSFVYRKEVVKGSTDYKTILEVYKIDKELYRKPDGERWTIIKL